MLVHFLYPLHRYFTPLNVFRYITFRGAYAALTALLISFLFGPYIIKALHQLKFGQSIRDDGPESHFKKCGTPTMGGILVIVAVSVACLFWEDLGNSDFWLVLISFIAFGLIGFLDDYLKIKKKNSNGLPAWGKLILQTSLALIIVFYLYFTGDEKTTYLYIPFLKNPAIDLGVIWIPFAVLLLVGESNAVNLSDGLDGLATGLVLMVFLTLAVVSYISGRADYAEYLGIPFIKGAGELAVFSLAVVVAAVGFLWFNAHPAEVFMGDVGSLAFGAAIATLSLVLKKELFVLIAGGVFVIEAASVMIQVISFKLRKKRVFRMAPLHHHFELSGWAESKVVVRFWILGGLFAIIALSTLKIQ